MADWGDTSSPYRSNEAQRFSDPTVSLSQRRSLSDLGSPSQPQDTSAGTFSTNFFLDEPIVEAIYPSFMILSWTSPRQVGSSPQGSGDRAGWKYVVEWQGTSALEGHTTQVSVCHCVLPIEFSLESYFVRVVAKGTVLTAVDAAANVFVTSKITVPTRRKTSLPWLIDNAVMSPLLSDALLLGSNAALIGDEAALSSLSLSTSATLLGRGSLKQFEFVAISVTYELPPLPLGHARAVFVVMQNQRWDDNQPLGSSFLSPSEHPVREGGMNGFALVNLLRKETCSIVFTGVGRFAGTAASSIAHRLIASLLAEQRHDSPQPTRKLNTDRNDKSSTVCSNVFCVTFGSPREEFFSNGLVLAGTAAFSGQFLHYSSSIATPAKTSGFSDGPSPTDPNGLPKKQASKYVNTPLGVRVGPIFDAAASSWHLRATASAFERKATDEETDDSFDCLTALATLRAVAQGNSLVDAVQHFSPSICSASCHLGHNGLSCRIVVRGFNLNFEPMLVVFPVAGGEKAMHGRYATACTIVSSSSVELVARFSLLDVTSVLPVKDKSKLDWTFKIVLRTQAGIASGSAALSSVSLESVIDNVVCLVDKPKASGWMTAPPQHLISAALAMEPIVASSHEINISSFVPLTTTKVLSSLEDLSELLASNIGGRKKETSIFSLIAARVQGGSQAPSTFASAGVTQLLPIVVPNPDSGSFAKVLSEHIAKRRPCRAFPAAVLQWKTRLFANLSWLDDAAYRSRLSALYFALVLQCSVPSTQAHIVIPLVTLECALLTKVIETLSEDTHLFPNIKFSEPLSSVMTFDVFYRVAQPIVAQRGEYLRHSTAVDVLNDVALLWASSLIWHIRRTYLCGRFVLICGPTPGCGTSTLMNQMKLIRSDLEFARAVDPVGLDPQIFVRRLVGQNWQDTVDVISLGVDATVIVVADTSSVNTAQVQQILQQLRKQIDGSLTSKASRQRAILLLTKIDEILDLGVNGCAMSPNEYAHSVISYMTQRFAASGWAADQFSSHCISLQPSLTALSRHVAACHDLRMTALELQQSLIASGTEYLSQVLKDLHTL